METYEIMGLEAKKDSSEKDNSSEDAPIPHQRIETLKKTSK
jgi:hypothetical protein